jgi:RND family efflux transporter MFP subunit
MLNPLETQLCPSGDDNRLSSFFTVSEGVFAMHSSIPLLRTWMGLLLLLVGLSACEAESASEERKVARPVKAAVVESAPQKRTVTYSGVVRPRIESVVGFRVGGKVVERLVNVGDRVEVGQRIARLDDTDLKLAEKAAIATLTAARTRREVASINLDRAKPLLPKGFITKAEFDIRRNEMDAASSAFDSAEAGLRQATNAVGYATLRADAAGTITSVTAEPGQVLSAGQPVVTLAKAGETEIAIDVPEQETGRLLIGQHADISLWARPHDSLAGHVREIAGQADTASRTYAVRIAVNSPPPSMRLGMTASVSIRVDEEAAPMVVPLTAVTESDGATVVFVIDPMNQVVRKTPVVLGGSTDGGVKIAGGLQAGDTVATAGVQFLSDGMRVKLLSER